jgi:hypothetical protein
MLKSKNKSKRSGRNTKIERQERSKFGMYRGPIRVGESKYSDKLDVVNLTSVTQVSSSALGVMAAELTFNPNTTFEWASFAARYREYRVLAVELSWEPNFMVNTATSLGGPIYIALNKGGALGTPTSKGQVLAMADSECRSSYKKWNYQIRPDDYTDLDVGSTSTPSSEFSFVFFANAFTASTVFGDFAQRWVVQFSSRQ